MLSPALIKFISKIFEEIWVHILRTLDPSMEKKKRKSDRKKKENPKEETPVESPKP
jgi:hypothetical protein